MLRFPSLKAKEKRPILKYIRKRRRDGPLHFTLIDPDKQSAREAAALAQRMVAAGTDGILVGGSHAAHLVGLDETVRQIKQKVKVPVILFPSAHSGLSKFADAVFFMSLLNSRSAQYLIEEQMKGSILVRSFGIEALPMGYIIVESGATTAAGWAGDVRLIPREKPEFALGYALAAKYLGMRFVYLEAGSGAKESVPAEMIALLKENLGPDTFVIVGGGIRDPKTAREKVKAGADIIVTGTIAERSPERAKKVIAAVKGRNGNHNAHPEKRKLGLRFRKRDGKRGLRLRLRKR